MKVILINGPYGSGKDTLGAFLQECDWLCGRQKVMHINFADWVKDAAKRYFNWDGIKRTEDGRHFLQYFATDIVRHQDPTYWADTVARLCYALRNIFEVFIITDWRFPNELESFLNYIPYSDIITIHIDRKMEDQETRKHESENSLPSYIFDYYVDNNGSLEDLQYNAEQIFRSIK